MFMRDRSTSAGRHDFVAGGPEIEVLLLYRGGHHAGEEVRGAGERRDAQRGHSGGLPAVVARGSVVAEGEEAYHRNATVQYSGRPLQHGLRETSLVAVCDEHHDRFGRTGDDALAVR